MSDAELADEREHILKAIKCVHARVPSQLSRFFFKSGAAQSLGCGGPCCTAPCSRVRRRWVGRRHCRCATVGAARVVHQALPCYRAQAQARFAIGGGGADGHQPHGLCVEPAMARMLATLGGLDSSGAAC